MLITRKYNPHLSGSLTLVLIISTLFPIYNVIILRRKKNIKKEKEIPSSAQLFNQDSPLYVTKTCLKIIEGIPNRCLLHSLIIFTETYLFISYLSRLPLPRTTHSSATPLSTLSRKHTITNLRDSQHTQQ